MIYKIVSDNLNLKKLWSRWVPKLVTEEHNIKRLECSLKFLTRYDKESDNILSQIVTEDETRVSHFTPEIEATKHGMETHTISRIVQSQTDSVPVQDHCVRVMG